MTAVRTRDDRDLFVLIARCCCSGRISLISVLLCVFGTLCIVILIGITRRLLTLALQIITNY